MRLAEGAARSRNAAAAQKHVTDAKKLISDAPANADLQRKKQSSLNDLLERVCDCAKEIGDAGGAAASRADQTVPPDPAVDR